MVVNIIPLGGIGEVGSNSVAVDINGKILILDFGFHLERFIEVVQDSYPHKNLLRKLLSNRAFPNIRSLSKRKKDIVGIFCSHAHLDHVGAIPYLLKRLKNPPIFATEFTANIIRSLCDEQEISPTVNVKNVNSIFSINNLPDVKIEFVNVAHSTPQTVAIVIHTPELIIIYANDFKNDQDSPFELPTNMTRFKEIASSKKKKVLILDSLYAPRKDFCKSESFARDEVLSLKDSLLNKRAVIVSTFSSHIFRLKSLVDLGQSLGREIVFIGRSLDRYISAGKHLIDLSEFGRIIKYRNESRVFFRKFDPKKYFLIVTGHQGEPQAVLSRMTDGEFLFSENDVVVFSCTTIPSEVNIHNRSVLESKLLKKNVSIIKDVHVSGHAFNFDHAAFLDLLKPDLLIPYHGDPLMSDAMISLAKSKKISTIKPRIGELVKLFD